MAIIKKTQEKSFLVMKETNEDSPIYQGLRIGTICYEEDASPLSQSFIYTINPHTSEQILICASDSKYALEYLAYNGDELAEKRYRLITHILAMSKKIDIYQIDNKVFYQYYNIEDNQWITTCLLKAPISDLKTLSLVIDHVSTM